MGGGQEEGRRTVMTTTTRECLPCIDSHGSAATFDAFDAPGLPRPYRSRIWIWCPTGRPYDSLPRRSPLLSRPASSAGMAAVTLGGLPLPLFRGSWLGMTGTRGCSCFRSSARNPRHVRRFFARHHQAQHVRYNFGICPGTPRSFRKKS